MAYTWNVRTKVLFGAGKLKELWPEGSKFPNALPDHALSRYPELKESLMSCCVLPATDIFLNDDELSEFAIRL